MQGRQNTTIYHTGESDSGPAASPVLKPTQEYKPTSFKSPLTSAQKRKSKRNKANDENIEPNSNNPFSGPIFFPTHFNKGKSSPMSLTPSKIKQEIGLMDANGGIREQNISRPYESPFTAFCKDLTYSPGSYNMTSPSALVLKMHHNAGTIHNMTYSPLFDNHNSPTFATKNITKLDFNNPSKLITLKSHRDEISIETDDQADLLELHKPRDSRLLTTNEDDGYNHPILMSLPAKNSIYVGSMVPSQGRNHEVYSQRNTQDSLGNKDFRFAGALEPIPEEETHQANPSLSEKSDEKHDHGDVERCLRTPSPTSASFNRKFKLSTINSFSGQAKRQNSGTTKKEHTPNGHGHNEDSGSSLVKRRFVDDDSEEKERGTESRKQKKRVCCNCKKSRCLKLYCDCFGRGQPCSKECNCVNCYNTEAHFAERQEAMVSILDRNPSAFKPKVDRTESPEKAEYEDLGRVRHMKGCNCKKSGCLKRYCECFQAGVKCTELCKCENCKNMDSCCRFKRAQKYGFVNFPSQDSLTMDMAYSDTKSMNINYRHFYPDEEIYSYPDEEGSRHYHSQSRVRLINPYQDPSFYSEIPQTKRRKLDVSVSQFTPKKTLIFPKEESKEPNHKVESEYQTYSEKKKGNNHYRTVYAQTEKKKTESIGKIGEYTPSPGKPLSGRRTKRNIRPFSQFHPDEYELRK